MRRLRAGKEYFGYHKIVALGQHECLHDEVGGVFDGYILIVRTQRVTVILADLHGGIERQVVEPDGQRGVICQAGISHAHAAADAVSLTHVTVLNRDTLVTQLAGVRQVDQHMQYTGVFPRLVGFAACQQQWQHAEC